MIKHMLALLTGSVLVGAGGCAPTKHSTMPTTMSTAAQRTDLRAAIFSRIGSIKEPLHQNELRLAQMPGSDEAQQRQLIAGCLSDYTILLPLLSGMQTTGAFDEQMRLIDEDRQRLVAMSMDVPSAPTISSAFGAVYAALSDIQTNEFSDDAGLRKSLTDLQGNLEDLDQTTGP